MPRNIPKAIACAVDVATTQSNSFNSRLTAITASRSSPRSFTGVAHPSSEFRTPAHHPTRAGASITATS